jgi:quercetin dioxygenase-like cupin family protein
MLNWRTAVIDDPSFWPKDHLVPLDSAHSDERGEIQSLVNYPVKNTSLITSKKGTVRSNHYHVTDWHYMYIISGLVDYYYRPTGTDQEPTKVVLKKGDMVFTPPMEDHATVFIEDTVLLAMSRNPRDQEAYESDVKRIILIDPNSITVE